VLGAGELQGLEQDGVMTYENVVVVDDDGSDNYDADDKL